MQQLKIGVKNLINGYMVLMKKKTFLFLTQLSKNIIKIFWHLVINFKYLNNFNFRSKTYESRKNIIDEWRREHGVLITSYELYRSVVNYKYIDKFPSILEGLVDPGPDLVICDEGHVIKNHVTTVSKAVNRIKTLRRIVLTGTPLQNNLKECMYCL